MNETGSPLLPLLGGWGLLAASGLIAAWWVVAALRRRPWMRLPPAPWGVGLAIAALYGMLAADLAAAYCLTALGVENDVEANPLAFTLAGSLGRGVLVGLLWLRLRTICGGTPAAALALWPGSWRRVGAVSALGYAGLWVPVLLARWAVVDVATRLGIEPDDQPLIQALRRELPHWQVNTVAAMVLISAPLIEEFLFRGILYRALRNVSRRPWLPLLASSVVFAALHFHPFTFLPLVMLGIVLAVVYEEAGTLWAPVLLHAAFNASQLCLLMRSL